MLPETLKGKKPLSEPQARTLARWWGGEYLTQTLPSDQGVQVLHGVTLTSGPEARTGRGSPPARSLWSWEEARDLENCRSSMNPAAEEWLG
jgi:hypothetical protein